MAKTPTKAAKAAPAAAPRPEPTGRFVRLTGVATRAGGKLLPIGKSLEIGVDIPEALALARLEARTAETVQGTAITAKVLRDAVARLLGKLRAESAELIERMNEADDRDLIDILRDDLLAPKPSDETRGMADAIEAAMAAHKAAIETEASAEGSGGGSDAA